MHRWGEGYVQLQVHVSDGFVGQCIDRGRMRKATSPHWWWGSSIVEGKNQEHRKCEYLKCNYTLVVW